MRAAIAANDAATPGSEQDHRGDDLHGLVVPLGKAVGGARDERHSV